MQKIDTEAQKKKFELFPQRLASTAEAQSMREILENDRGTATIEYLIVLLALSILAAGAILAIGPGLIEVFQLRIAWLALPFP